MFIGVCLCVSKELRGKSPKERENTPTDSTDLLTRLTPGLLHGRGLWCSQKWRDVEEPPGVVLVQAEEMSAVRTPVAPEQVRTFAHQMEDPVLPARRAMLDVHVGQVLGLLRGRGLETPQRSAKDPAPTLRADTTAPVFNDEEKPARATAQEHKVARVRYRSDVGGSAFSAGCDRATTLIAVARHVEIHRFCRTERASRAQTIRAKSGRRGRNVWQKSREAIPFVSLGMGWHRKSRPEAQGTASEGSRSIFQIQMDGP